MPRLAATPLSVRIAAASLHALNGGIVMAGLLVLMGGRLTSDLELIVFAAIGAFSSGAIVAPMFGQVVPGGWAWAGLGALLATFCGAALGGLFLGVFSILFWGGAGIALNELWMLPVFAVVLVFQMLASSVLGLVWLALMVFVHLVIRSVRKFA